MNWTANEISPLTCHQCPWEKHWTATRDRRSALDKMHLQNDTSAVLKWQEPSLSHKPLLMYLRTCPHESVLLLMVIWGHCFPSWACADECVNVCLCVLPCRQFETVIPTEDSVITEITMTLRDWGTMWKQLYMVKYLSLCYAEQIELI